MSPTHFPFPVYQVGEIIAPSLSLLQGMFTLRDADTAYNYNNNNDPLYCFLASMTH